jgi:hypothetical protein
MDILREKRKWDPSNPGNKTEEASKHLNQKTQKLYSILSAYSRHLIDSYSDRS